MVANEINTLIKGAWSQIQVKFHMPFLILTVL
jgi:hypothetical protein